MADFVRIPSHCPDGVGFGSVTKGKVYEVIKTHGMQASAAWIVSDTGNQILVGVGFPCAFLDDTYRWQRCSADGTPITPIPPLTPRESEILALLTSDVTPISDAVEQVVTMLQEARQ